MQDGRQTRIPLSPSVLLMCADDDRTTSVKRRSQFRLLFELLLVGLMDDVAVVLSVIKALAVMDLQRERDTAQAALSMLASMCKSYRGEVLGLPVKIPAAAQLPSTAEEVSVWVS